MRVDHGKDTGNNVGRNLTALLLAVTIATLLSAGACEFFSASEAERPPEKPTAEQGQHPAETQAGQEPEATAPKDSTPPAEEPTAATPRPTPAAGKMEDEETPKPRREPPGALAVGYAELSKGGEEPTLRIPAGTVIQLQGYGRNEGEPYQRLPYDELKWTTNSPEWFQLTPDGRILATYAARGLLTVYHGNLQLRLKVVAEGEPRRTMRELINLRLEPSTLTLAGPGHTAGLKGVGIYRDGSRGPLPQGSEQRVTYSLEPEGKVVINSHGEVKALEPGKTQIWAHMEGLNAAEPVTVYVTPPRHLVQPDMHCSVRDPASPSGMVTANRLRVTLYDTRDNPANAEEVVRAVDGVVAYYSDNNDAHVIDIPCPGTGHQEITNGLQEVLLTLLNDPAVSHAMAEHEDRSASPPPTQSQETASAPQEVRLEEAAAREGDEIVNIAATPARIRLTPGQQAGVESITLNMAGKGQVEINPAGGQATYRLVPADDETDEGNPAKTGEILLSEDGTMTALNTARTGTYQLIIFVKGHRTRIRVDVRGSDRPLEWHNTQCLTETGLTGQIMLEFEDERAAHAAPEIASAFGGRVTGEYEEFHGRVIDFPCNSRHDVSNALDITGEFEGVAEAYVHIPTQGDLGPELSEPIPDPGNALIRLLPGGSHTLRMSKGRYHDGAEREMRPAERANLSLESDNRAVATIDPETWVITAHDKGTATILVTNNGRIATTVSVVVE